MAAEGSGGNYDNPNNKPDVKAGVKPPITPEVLGNVLAGIDFYHTEQSKTEEVKEQLSRVMTETLGSPYKSVDELDKVIEQGGNTNEVTRAKRDRKLLADGVDVALRKKRESDQISDDELRLGSQHLTNGLHEVIKGVGGDVSDRYVDKGLDSHLNRLEAARLNRNSHIDDSAYTEMLLQRIDMAIPKVLSVESDNSDAVVVALNHERTKLKVELGYEPNSSVGSVGAVEQKGASGKRTEVSTEEKKRAPGPTARLNETMQESNTINQENIEVTEKASEAIIEGTKAGIEFMKSQIEGNALLAGFKKPLDALVGLIEESNTLTAQQIEKMHEQIEWMCLQIDALNKNTESLDQVTLAIMELTTSAKMLGVDVRNLTTAVSKEQVTRIAAQLKDSGIDFASLTDSDRDEISRKLAREVDDPSVVDSKNPQDLVRARELKLELEKAQLLQRLDKQIVDRQRGRRRGGETDLPPENREGWDGSVDALYRWLNEIEHGDRSVDDLSTNSTKFGFLYHAKNGEYDNFFEHNAKAVMVDKDGRLVLESGEKAVGTRALTKEELKLMKYEIDMRLFLHSFYRAASKCATIDDMAKVIISMHEGDIENMGDKAIVSFFLNRVKDSGGVGLQKLPTDIAWNMRQEGYFRIEQFTERMKGRKMEFFEGLKKMMAENMKIGVDALDALGAVDSEGKILWNGLDEKAGDSLQMDGDTVSLFKKIAMFDSATGKWILDQEDGNGFDELTKFKVEIPAMPQFNFNKPVNQNLDCFEQRNELKGVLIKEYTIWRMMESDKGKYSQDQARKYSQDQARKAYTLARRLAVATFMKNKANLIFDQDDYAEKLNFMFERLEDGPWGKDGLEGKGKLVGARETLGYVYGLTPHWMDVLKSDLIEVSYVDIDGVTKKKKLPRAFETAYAPLYSNDIDWDKYNYRTTQIYHALGILSQVEFVDDAWRNKCTPNDVNAVGFLNKLFSKMNKLSYEMERAKVKSLEIKDKPDIYNLFMATKDGKLDPKDPGYIWAKRHLAESFRYAWVVNLLSRIANEKSLGWTVGQLDDFIQELGYKSTLFGVMKIKKGEFGDDEVEKIKGTGFIPRQLLKKAIKETKVYQALRGYDQQRYDASQTQKTQQSGMGWGSFGKK